MFGRQAYFSHTQQSKFEPSLLSSNNKIKKMSKTQIETIPTLRLTSTSKIKALLSGIQINPLPPFKKRNEEIAHAP